jgi:hypothetical protein
MTQQCSSYARVPVGAISSKVGHMTLPSFHAAFRDKKHKA